MSLQITLNGADVGYLIHGAPFELEIQTDHEVRLVIWNPRQLEKRFYDVDYWKEQLHFLRGKSVFRGLSNFYKPYLTMWTWHGWNPFSFRRFTIKLKVEFPNTIVPQVDLIDRKLADVMLVTFRPVAVRMVSKKIADPLLSNKESVKLPKLLTIKPNHINLQIN